MNKFFNVVLRFRILFITLLFIINGLLAYAACQLKLYDDPNKWPSGSHRYVRLNDYIQREFGGSNVVTIELIVKNGDIFNRDTLGKVERITQQILRMRGAVPFYVTSLNALHVKYMRGDEVSLDISPLMERCPATPEEIERVKFGVSHNPTIYGSLVSPDEKATVIIADFRTGERAMGEVRAVPRTDPVPIYKEITRIIQPENDETTVVRCAGTPIIIGWVNSEGLPYIKAALVFFGIVMVLVLWLAFRRIQGVVVTVLVGLSAITWGFGVQAIVFGDILRSSSALIAPFVIIAATGCHSVQFLRRFFYEEFPRQGEPLGGLQSTFEALFMPMTLSLIADVVAFLVLMVVPFQNVSVLGSVTMFGMVGIFINYYLLGLPLISYFPGRVETGIKEQEEIAAESILDKWLHSAVRALVLPTRAGWIVMASLTGIFIWSVAVMPRIQPGQDNTYAIHNYLTKSWKNNSIYQMEMLVKEKFKGVYPLNILIQTKNKGGLTSPQILQQIDNFAVYLQKIPEVAGCSCLSLYVKLMNRFLHNENNEYFVLPEEERNIGEYLYMYSSGDPASFDAVMDWDMQKTILAAYVVSTSQPVVSKILKAAKEYAQNNFDPQEVTVEVGGGAIAIAGAFNEDITKWLFLATFWSALGSLLAVLLLFRSLVAGVLMLLPLLAGTVIWLAMMYLVGIEINSNTTTSMSIAMGVGIDAELYFLYRFREEFKILKDYKAALILAFQKIRKALIFSHMALILACFSLIPIPLYVGYVGFGMGMIILVCFVVSFIVSPFLWSLLKPKFLFRS